MADKEVVCETLDIKRWNYPLVNKGDAALRIQGINKEFSQRAAALTTSNSRNREVIRDLATSFYRMGVYIPDMRTIGLGYNRNEDYIKEELKKLTDG